MRRPTNKARENMFRQIALFCIFTITIIWCLAPNWSVASHQRVAFLSVGGQDVTAAESPGFFKGVIGGILGYGLPTEPLKAKTFYAKLVPGYWTSSSDGTILTGGGMSKFAMEGVSVSGGLVYSFTDHWGISLLGSYAKSISGTAGAIGLKPTGSPTNLNTNFITLPAEGNGYSFSANLIYDYFEGENFRLPVFVGLGYHGYTSKAEGTSSVSGTPIHALTETQLSSPGFTIGLAPQWNWGSFRLIPFVTSAGTFNKADASQSLTNLSTGATSTGGRVSDEKNFTAAGITVKYRPWNLGLSYVRGDLIPEKGAKTDTSLYTFTWDHTW